MLTVPLYHVSFELFTDIKNDPFGSHVSVRVSERWGVSFPDGSPMLFKDWCLLPSFRELKAFPYKNFVKMETNGNLKVQCLVNKTDES